MATRENWQLGRPMEYPYAAPPPRRQVAYVFDTNATPFTRPSGRVFTC